MIKFNFISKLFKIAAVIIILSFYGGLLFGTHNVSRYFPFLERPQEYITKKTSHITPALFVTQASSAFKRGGGNVGIPELWGEYDLKNVIDSLKSVNVNDSSYSSPIIRERGDHDDWIDKSMRFKVDGKAKSRGLLLNYEQYLGWNFTLGAFVPLMYVNTNDHFTFLQDESASIFQNLRPGEADQLDRIRRMAQDDLGLYGGDWTQAGFGDLDLHLRYGYNWNYRLMMRSINLNLQPGVIIPTGKVSDINYSSAIPFMSDGHWGCYFDIVTQFELKQNWIFGLMLGAVYQFSHTRNLRIPVYEEPAIFSALKANVKVEPGMTFKISPYITLENLTDGVNFEFRYTYLRHNQDTWKDTRVDPTIKSYLNQEPPGEVGDIALTADGIANNIAQKGSLLRWRTHYLTFELSYHSGEAGNKWVLDPTIFLTLDYLVNGSAFCKTSQLTLGVDLHF